MVDRQGQIHHLPNNHLLAGAPIIAINWQQEVRSLRASDSYRASAMRRELLQSTQQCGSSSLP
jgi:hypothetical protein